MGKSFSFSLFRVAIAVGLLATCLPLTGDNRPAFDRHSKSFYADPGVVAFVRPGLVLKITAARIAGDGTISADFSLTDPQGLPLDMAGVYSGGTVSVSFIAAYIPKGATQYSAYTTTVQKSPITGNSATQASTDRGGAFVSNGSGQYTYTFHTKAPSGYDPTVTHSVGAYATRDLSAFNLGTQYANDVFSFVPNGAAVTVVRDVVETQSCNQCHDPLSAHGGARQLTQLCVMCHTPQTTDPDTGNTVDFKVMIHKIHMGASLPSVLAGGKYEIIGFQQSVNDFSTVVFPSDVRNCTICHTPTAKQANNYLTQPTRAACGACHDDVNFATGANHPAGIQTSDANCATCHTPQGQLEFDASVAGAHVIPANSKQVAGVVFTIQKVDNGLAGKNPTVTFTVKDKSGNPIALSTMGRLSLALAGPTTDYSTEISETATSAQGGNGVYTYTFKNAIPAAATGTYAIGIEGYVTRTVAIANSQTTSVEDAGLNQVSYFSVDGSTVVPRRAVVALSNCNVCHTALAAHGGMRNNVEYCVFCHNPTATDAAVRPASAGAAQGIDFVMLVHKIHRGENLVNGYTVYGFQGSINNFSGVQFPGDLRDCAKCHENNSYQVPSGGTLNVANPRGYINPSPPTATACLACHDGQDSAAHAKGNINQLGEACVVCHASDAAYSVDFVHAR